MVLVGLLVVVRQLGLVGSTVQSTGVVALLAALVVVLVVVVVVFVVLVVSLSRSLKPVSVVLFVVLLVLKQGKGTPGTMSHEERMPKVGKMLLKPVLLLVWDPWWSCAIAGTATVNTNITIAATIRATLTRFTAFPPSSSVGRDSSASPCYATIPMCQTILRT